MTVVGVGSRERLRRLSVLLRIGLDRVWLHVRSRPGCSRAGCCPRVCASAWLEGAGYVAHGGVGGQHARWLRGGVARSRLEYIELWRVCRVWLLWLLLVCFGRVLQGRSVGRQASVGAAGRGILLRVRGGRRVGHSEPWEGVAVKGQGYRWSLGVLEAGGARPYTSAQLTLADHVGVSRKQRC